MPDIPVNGTDSQYETNKGRVHPKWKLCHHLLTLMSSQTCMNFFPLWNTKGKILQNVKTALFH